MHRKIGNMSKLSSVGIPRALPSVALGLCLLLPTSMLGDFEYQETTQITGGSIMGMMKLAGAFSKQARSLGDPTVSTIYIKGNKMARIAKDHSEIVDLDNETITEIDNVKRTYSVMTFEQMKQQIEAASAKLQQEQAKQTKAAPPPQKPDNVDLSFDVKVRNTGATKEVAGLSSTEAILSMALKATDTTNGQNGSLAITNDMWMVPEIPGYNQVRDFDRKYAIKMGMVLSGAVTPQLLAMQPGAGQGMAQMAKEMSKVKGVPVLQVMRMGVTTDGQPLPAASEAPLPPSDSPTTPSAGDVAQQSATSAIANKLGVLGGLGGFGHKKKQDPPPTQDAGAPPPTSSVLIESSTQVTNFSSAAVDVANFQPPAGYTKVSTQQ